MKSRANVVKNAAIFLSVCAMAGLGQTQAKTVLSDGNSSAYINFDTQAGMYNWTVDGVNQLYQQWFWYRIGATGPESSIDTIGAPSLTLHSANWVTSTYTASRFTLSVDYVLTGGTLGSGNSHISESIRILNTSATALDMHFFQYSDFDLNGNPNGDTVQLARNGQGLFYDALQTKGPFRLSETDVTPGANHGEVDTYMNTINRLNDGVATTLNDSSGPVGPSDVTWALEWDTTINPGNTFLISKNKDIELVPEPGVLSLLSLGVAGLLWRKRGQTA